MSTDQEKWYDKVRELNELTGGEPFYTLERKDPYKVLCLIRYKNNLGAYSSSKGGGENLTDMLSDRLLDNLIGEAIKRRLPNTFWAYEKKNAE